MEMKQEIRWAHIPSGLMGQDEQESTLDHRMERVGMVELRGIQGT